MLVLKRADYPGDYFGFHLKEGSWYGEDTKSGTKIASSGYESRGSLAVYFQQKGKWVRRWVDLEETRIRLGNLPEIDFDSKLCLEKWLIQQYGMSWNQWLSLDKGEMERIGSEYDDYYYEGLSSFAQEYLEYGRLEDNFNECPED